LFHSAQVLVTQFIGQAFANSAGIVPIPNANLSGSQQAYSTLPEQHTTQQSLHYLDEELIKTQGLSSAAQRARHDLKTFLDPAFISDL